MHLGADEKVVDHAHPGKELAAFGHQADAPADDLGGRKPLDGVTQRAHFSRADRHEAALRPPDETARQRQINEAAGTTFANGLRSILRQDPDAVLVGEIRDIETARIAVQAALTGHFVMSSIHATDACSALFRLVDMGIEGFLVASSLVGVVGQRLVRRICPKCKTDYEPDRAHLPTDLELAPGEKLWRGAGCQNCRNTGYRGRSGLYELMVMSDAIAEKIIERAPSPQIVAVAKQAGLRLLRDDGWDKVRQGITTPDEVVMCTAL